MSQVVFNEGDVTYASTYVAYNGDTTDLAAGPDYWLRFQTQAEMKSALQAAGLSDTWPYSSDPSILVDVIGAMPQPRYDQNGTVIPESQKPQKYHVNIYCSNGVISDNLKVYLIEPSSPSRKRL